MTSRPTTRVLFYVQHLLGIGHLRRAAAIARALREAGAEVDFVSGGAPVEGLDLGGATLLQLPPAVSADSGFSAILDETGNPIDDIWKDRRRAQLLDIFARRRPDILLIEMYPFGRRQFRFELLPLLQAATERPAAQGGRPLIACSLRDILVDKSRPDRVAETVEAVRRYFDLVLVHGDPRLVTLDRTFAGAAALAAQLRYTGYVVEQPQMPADGKRDRRDGEILVSAGGGAVGAPLFAAALAARPLSRYRDRPWRLITGRNLPAPAARQLAEQARTAGGVIVETFRQDFTLLLQSCLLSISQGGYNTVMELIAAETPSVIVPFADGAESEQSLRARLLAERGSLTLLESDRLTPEALAAAIDRAGEQAPDRDASFTLDLDGARRSAAILLQRCGGTP
ncbi:MAG: glycosyltransferase [Dongiaceae bacterium]